MAGSIRYGKRREITQLHHVIHKENLSTLIDISDRTHNFKEHKLGYHCASPKWLMMDNTKTVAPLTGIKRCHFRLQPFLLSYQITNKCLVYQYGKCMHEITHYRTTIRRYRTYSKGMYTYSKYMDTLIIVKYVYSFTLHYYTKYRDISMYCYVSTLYIRTD